ncbi:winged helix-turn-helix domain-containing protein [Buttiauxella noackiae]|uniref:winged helix-turn-helix domain-containing protein n=1 Tax=Buttiauxella noackiae TaxID=82992 RepID=UPI0028D8B85B|nr:winged helix-turn-helix domain-containing protein [Buttiauxella noackiae]
MTTTRQRIHQYISEHPNISVNEIAAALNISRNCVSPQVSNLFKDGLVTRTGNAGGYRFSSGPVEATEEKPVLHMSADMALFNKLLRGVRAS